MTATATPPRRPRVSDEFLQRNTRDRILAGMAKAIAQHGYRATKVADIVGVARVARKTFYDNFSGKEEAGLALVAERGLEIEEASESRSLDLLLIELAAVAIAELELVPTARELAIDGEQLIRYLVDCELASMPPADDPRQRSLPPGRHGLPASFKNENQRTRLLSGCAAAFAERGFLATTIANVTAEAAVSRRTFYEHFRSLEEAATAMTAAAVPTSTAVDQLEQGSALAAVAADVVAERLTAGASPLAARALEALPAIAWARPS